MKQCPKRYLKDIQFCNESEFIVKRKKLAYDWESVGLELNQTNNWKGHGEIQIKGNKIWKIDVFRNEYQHYFKFLASSIITSWLFNFSKNQLNGVPESKFGLFIFNIK